jgi:hypothetical protein
MTQAKLFEIVSEKTQREFDPNETIQWLTINPSIFWSWGVSKKINLYDKALLLNVSGHHFKGWVVITLAWDDTYSIFYINTNGTIVGEQHNVYCDMLRDVIDDRIEKVKDYQF